MRHSRETASCQDLRIFAHRATVASMNSYSPISCKLARDNPTSKPSGFLLGASLRCHWLRASLKMQQPAEPVGQTEKDHYCSSLARVPSRSLPTNPLRPSSLHIMAWAETTCAGRPSEFYAVPVNHDLVPKYYNVLRWLNMSPASCLCGGPHQLLHKAKVCTITLRMQNLEYQEMQNVLKLRIQNCTQNVACVCVCVDFSGVRIIHRVY